MRARFALLPERTMKKILFLANHFIILYSFRKELISELLSKGYEVYLSLPQNEDNEYFRSLGCKIIETDIDRHGVNAVKDGLLIRRYKRIIKSVKPDVVLTYTIKPNVYGGIACKRLKVPYISNVTGLGSAISNGGLIKSVALSLYKISQKKASMVFFQNDENKDFMVKNRIIKGNYEVLPGSGVNLIENKFEPYPEESGKTVFVTIGRIMKDKGIDELLLSAKELKEKHDDIAFKLVGGFDDDYKAKIERAEKEGIIEYVGFTKDVHSAIKNSHATIHPSYHEGTSNVLLETASCGRPIIASNVAGCNNTFDDGVSGIAFEPKNAAALTLAVEKFLLLSNEERAEMGRRGREKMEKEFDRRFVIDAYLREIEKICKEN